MDKAAASRGDSESPRAAVTRLHTIVPSLFSQCLDWDPLSLAHVAPPAVSAAERARLRTHAFTRGPKTGLTGGLSGPSALEEPPQGGGNALEIRIANPTDWKLLRQIRAEAEADYSSRARRRRQEHELADYIERNCQPLGPVKELSKLVGRLRGCRTHGTFGAKPDGGLITIWDSKCNHVRLCPDEARAETQRLAERYIPEVENFLRERTRHTVQYAVFTAPNAPEHHLAKTKCQMFKAFARLTQRKCFRSVKGCLAIMEDPLAADNKSWNVHINVLLLVDQFLDWGEVRAAWGWNIHFQGENELIEHTRKKFERRGFTTRATDRTSMLVRAFNELCKYSAKIVPEKSAEKTRRRLTKAPSMIEWPPALWCEWFAAQCVGEGAFRRTRSYGRLYKIAEPEKEKLNLDDVRWIGMVQYRDSAYHLLIDLIPEDNSGGRGTLTGSTPMDDGHDPPV